MVGRRITCADCGTQFVAEADPFSGPHASEPLDTRGGPGRAGSRRASGTGAARWTLLGLGAVVVLGVAGYFAYQHFIVDHHPARKAAEMEALHYLPASSYVVVGIDVRNSLAKPEFAELFKKHLAANRNLNLTELLQGTLGLRLEDLDHVVLSVSKNESPAGMAPPGKAGAKKSEPDAETLVLQTRAVYDRGLILRKSKAGPAQKAQGKEYFRLPDNKDYSIVYMPSDRIVVLARGSDSQLGSIFRVDGRKPSLSNDTMTLLQHVGKAHAWMVTTLGPLRQQLPAGVPNHFQLARAFGFWIKSQGDRADLSLGMVCHDWDTARRLAGSFEKSTALWRKQVHFLPGTELQDIAREALDNLHFSSRESMFWGTTRLRMATLGKLPALPMPGVGALHQPGAPPRPPGGPKKGKP
jgi:hypothetical protein